jgi:hypothetical protein
MVRDALSGGRTARNARIGARRPAKNGYGADKLYRGSLNVLTGGMRFTSSCMAAIGYAQCGTAALTHSLWQGVPELHEVG